MREPVERELVSRITRVVGDSTQDRLDACGLDLRYAPRANRLLHLRERRVAHRLPRREAIAQAQVRDVAIAVVRRLREYRQHELRDRVPVRAHQRDAVHLAQPFAHAHHARASRPSPVRRWHRWPLYDRWPHRHHGIRVYPRRVPEPREPDAAVVGIPDFLRTTDTHPHVATDYM